MMAENLTSAAVLGWSSGSVNGKLKRLLASSTARLTVSFVGRGVSIANSQIWMGRRPDGGTHPLIA